MIHNNKFCCVFFSGKTLFSAGEPESAGCWVNNLVFKRVHPLQPSLLGHSRLQLILQMITVNTEDDNS